MTTRLPPSPRLAELARKLSVTQLLGFIKVTRTVIVAAESRYRVHASDYVIDKWNVTSNLKIAELLHGCLGTPSIPSSDNPL